MKKGLLMAVTVALIFAAAVSAEDGQILARIGDEKITTADYERIIGYYDAERQKMLRQNPQFKVNLLQTIVQGKVLAKIAREKGYDRKPEVREQIDLLMNSFLSSELIKGEVLVKISVTDQDAEAYYKAHQDEYRTPESARARHILIRADRSAPEAQKKEARGRAEEVLKKVKAGGDFAKLASEYSEDPGSKQNGGDLGFVQKGRTVPEFERAVFSLKPGQVSDVVETQFGYHIIKVEDRKESAVEPYDKVKDKVKEKVLNDQRKAKAEEYINAAMKDAKAEVKSELLLPKK
jgi:peptidyl-prolyl cis-trans isomerase C